MSMQESAFARDAGNVVDVVAVPVPAVDAPSGGAVVVRPSAAFMLSHPAHLIALGFGSGLSRIAPGTAGTLWGWLCWMALQTWMPWMQPWHGGALIAVSTLVGWWACTVTAQHLGTSDPGCVVWDEIVAIWLILWLMAPAGIWAQVAAVVLFRFFDAVKPGPVAWADAAFKGFGWRGGWGIMFDDFVAAFCTLLVMAAWRFWGFWGFWGFL